MTVGEARWLSVVFLLILAAHILFYKEFLYLSFDPQMAETQGYRPLRWSLAFYALLGLAIALAIKAIGMACMDSEDFREGVAEERLRYNQGEVRRVDQLRPGNNKTWRAAGDKTRAR